MKKTVLSLLVTVTMFSVHAQTVGSTIDPKSPYVYVGTRPADNVQVCKTNDSADHYNHIVVLSEPSRISPNSNYRSCPVKKVVKVEDMIWKKRKMYVKAPDGHNERVSDRNKVLKDIGIMVSYQELTLVFDSKKKQWVITKFNCMC